jgi:hypothetical protein
LRECIENISTLLIISSFYISKEKTLEHDCCIAVLPQTKDTECVGGEDIIQNAVGCEFHLVPLYPLVV